jgi:hypothetical protein
VAIPDHLKIILYGAHDLYGAGGVADDSLRHASQHPASEVYEIMCADEDQVRRPFPRLVRDDPLRVASHDSDFGLDAELAQALDGEGRYLLPPPPHFQAHGVGSVTRLAPHVLGTLSSSTTDTTRACVS